MIKKKIFLFGKNGFIGTNLVDLIKKKKNIKIIDNIIIKKKTYSLEDYYRFFWKEVVRKSETVVYLSFNNDLNQLENNLSKSISDTITPLYLLCEEIKKSKKNIKIIYLSTASLYANKVKLPANEKSKIEINNVYELLKFLSEEVLKKKNVTNLNYNILRLSNVYGENISNQTQENRQVLSKVITDALKNKCIKVYGSGNYYRDFVHVQDVCQAIYKLIIKNKFKNEIFNLGSGKKIKLISVFKDIRNLIYKNYGLSIRIKKINNKRYKVKLSDKRNFQASNIKLLNKTGWKPRIKFNIGLNQLIKFIYDKKY